MALDEQDTVTQSLPALPGAGPSMRILAVGSIVASRTNPRKTFAEGPLQELADSIKASGVHQPILVRPLPAARFEETSKALKSNVYAWPFATTRKREPIEYELVAGERRWRACQLAGESEIPAMIRELTDDQVLEIQIIENLQREDIGAIEEADGYRQLMELSNLNAKQVAERIKKSVRYVYARVQLLNLAPQAKDALRAGSIDKSIAREISRVVNPALQQKALEYAQTKDYAGKDRTFTEVQVWVRNNAMLRMDRARFDIASTTLCPDAGACASCPKRTGFDPEASDHDGPDMCTDPDCYHSKEEAHDAVAIAAAKKLGKKVIAGAEARELIQHPGERPRMKGYSCLDDSSYELGVYGESLRKALGKDCPEPVIVINPHDGKALAVVKTSEARKAISARKTASTDKQVAKQAAEQAAKPVEQRPAYRTRWLEKATDEVHARLVSRKSEAVPAEVLRSILIETVMYSEEGPLGQALGLPDEFNTSEVMSLLRSLPDEDMGALFMRWQLHEAIDSTHSGLDVMGMTAPRHMLRILAEHVGVNIEDVQATVKREMESEDRVKAMEAEEKKAAKPAAPKGASTPKPAAQPSTTRAKAKGKQGPAAQAPATAKTTTEEASAQIAAGLADLEAQDQAPAAQGIEGLAVADAQPGTAPSGGDGGASEAVNQAPMAQGDEAPPAAPAPATPSPSTKAGARPKRGAAVEGGVAPVGAWPFPGRGPTTPAVAPTPAPAAAAEIAEGAHVRVNAHVYAADKEAYAGLAGKVLGPLKGFKGTWRVEFTGDLPPGVKATNTFKAADLVVVTAEQAQAEAAPPAAEPVSFATGDLVRIKQGLRGPNGKMRKCCGRVGVLGNSGTKGLTVLLGKRHDQCVTQLNAEDLEPYKADPLIGSKVRVLRAGWTMQRAEFLWREGKVVGLREDGWLVEFSDKPGEPTQSTWGTEELEVIA